MPLSDEQLLDEIYSDPVVLVEDFIAAYERADRLKVFNDRELMQRYAILLRPLAQKMVDILV